MTAYDIVGLVGSFIISAALIPQIRKVVRTQSASDLSYTFLVSYVTGLTMIVIYGVGESLWPIWIPVSLELVGGLSLLGMKFKYDGAPGAKRVDAGNSVASPSVANNGATNFAHVLTPQ